MQKSRLLLVTLFLVISFQFGFAQKFVIPVFPDTQFEVAGNEPMFTSQMYWIVNHQKELNIPIVLHVGDLTNNRTPDEIQFKTASKGFKILDSAKIAYAITLGNHDNAGSVGRNGTPYKGEEPALRNTKTFNEYFPVSRFPLQKGRYQEGKSDNAWYTFKAGGLNWVVVTLEYCARQGAVDWADKVITNNPKSNVIILTHFHLKPDASIATNPAADLNPIAIWDQMIKKHSNVLMVLCGHTGTSEYRDDLGTNGNHIYQILQDYQGEKSGNGLLRLLEIDTKAGTIGAKMYSPFTNVTKSDSSQFVLSNVKFIGKK